jgi:hypothetical protein
MTAAFERLFYPFAHYFKGQVNADEPGPKAQNVAVIVTPAHACLERFASVHGSHSGHPVSRYAHPYSTAAHQDATIRLSSLYRARDSKGIYRVIDRIGTVRANVHHLYIRLSQRGSEKILQFKTGVIRSDEDFHKTPVNQKTKDK